MGPALTAVEEPIMKQKRHSVVTCSSPPPFLFLIVMLNFCIGWKLVIVLAVGVTLLLDNKYCCEPFHLLCYLLIRDYVGITSFPWPGLASIARWIS